jgi:hypothetical protein
MTAREILVSDWLLFKKIFSSETALQNGSIYVRSSIKLLLSLKNYEKRAITPRRVIRFNSKLQGM